MKYNNIIKLFILTCIILGALNFLISFDFSAESPSAVHQDKSHKVNISFNTSKHKPAEVCKN